MRLVENGVGRIFMAYFRELTVYYIRKRVLLSSGGPQTRGGQRNILLKNLLEVTGHFLHDV